MGLKLFNAPTLPKPSEGYDPGYFKQLIRIIGLYFSQLDSLTPNQAESYTADYFYTVNYSTVANLPTAADYKGARTFVTDAAAAPVFRAVATGGGALFSPVFCDGTNWRNG
jgi:hypothetical protein